MSYEFELSVTQNGTIFVEAESEEEAIEKYQQNQGHYYVITEDGNEVPASDSWELETEEEATYSLNRIIAISDDIKNDTEWVNDSKTKAQHEGVCYGLNMLINHLKEIEESEVSK